MISVAIVILIILAIVSLIDFKFKKIPAFFLTGIILTVALTHFYDFNVGLISLSMGILAFVYARALYEIEFIGGLADVKVMAIIGLMINSIQMFFTFMLLVVLFGMAYKLTFRYILKRKDNEEIPFILCLFFVYLTLFLIGGVA